MEVLVKLEAKELFQLLLGSIRPIFNIFSQELVTVLQKFFCTVTLFSVGSWDVSQSRSSPFPSLFPLRSVNTNLCYFLVLGSLVLGCNIGSLCLYGSLVHSGTEVSLSCGLSSLLTSPGFWWLLGVKLPFLPVCSSPEILLVMRTLLYAAQMNPLSVREPVSTKLLGSEAFHFLLLNRNVNTMQFSVLLNGCIALNEFLAGRAIIASIQCCCSPHCFSSKGHMPWTDQGCCFICMKHHLLGMNTFALISLIFLWCVRLLCRIQRHLFLIWQRQREENWLLGISAYP